MHARQHRSLYFAPVTVCLVLLLVLLPTAGVQARPAAAAPTVSTFYTTTTAAYDAWNPNASPNVPPRKATSFPAGTATIAVYYEYDGASPGVTKLSLAVKDGSGTTVVAGALDPLKYTSGIRMDLIDAPGGSFASGSYSVTLLQQSRQVAVAAFSISSAAASQGKATVFYTATKTAYDAWNSSTSDAPPARTTAFPSGSSVVAFYFEYQNTTPKVTQYQIIVHSPSGAVYAKRGPYTVSYDAGMVMRTILPDQDSAYHNGAYQADLLLAGHTQLRTTFTVGSSSGIVVSTLYPATKAAFDAWNTSTSDARPAKTTRFPAGTSVVTFYFEYKNFKVGTTTYTVVIKNQAGKTVVSHGPFVTKYKDGLLMSPIPGPGGAWPSGAYRADLVVNGTVMFSAFFSVGVTTPVAPACKSSDPLATCVEPACCVSTPTCPTTCRRKARALSSSRMRPAHTC